jgi:hypothetical protein
VKPEPEPAAPTATATSPRDRKANRGSIGGFPSWIVLLGIGACALALASAHLPPIFKKLGLFAVAYGLLVGLAGAWLSQFASGVHTRRRLAAALVFVVAIAGQCGIAAESYRIDRADRERRERADPKQALAHKLLESAEEPTDPKSRATFEEFRRSFSASGSSFVEYLQFRVSGIGIRSRWVVALFWGVEILLGGLAAGWVFFLRTGRVSAGSETCQAEVDTGRASTGGATPRAELDAAASPAKLEE